MTIDKLDKAKLFQFTDKVVESILHKNRVKQVYELQKVIQEIWDDGARSHYTNHLLEGDESLLDDSF